MSTFTGVLAVLHTPTDDRRQLDEPHPDLTRALPVSMYFGGDRVGCVDRVWRDGDLVRYSGHLVAVGSVAAAVRAGIRDRRLAGMLDAGDVPDDGVRFVRQGRVLSQEEVDALPLDADVSELQTVMSGWRVRGVTLMLSECKAWPEVSLMLDDPASSEEHTA